MKVGIQFVTLLQPQSWPCSTHYTARYGTEPTYSESGVHFSYQLWCCTQTKESAWKARHTRIWVSTEKSSGPEMRLDGGLWATSSFHAGFRLTAHITQNTHAVSINSYQLLMAKQLLYNTHPHTHTYAHPRIYIQYTNTHKHKKTTHYTH